MRMRSILEKQQYQCLQPFDALKRRKRFQEIIYSRQQYGEGNPPSSALYYNVFSAFVIILLFSK